MDSSVLRCVNPYDVNPISGTARTQEEVNMLGKYVKLEMEEFGDLAPFLTMAMSNSVDELNTPVFDRKGPFNFMVSGNAYIDSQAADPFKFEYDIIRTGNSVTSNKKLTDFPVYSNNMNVQLHETINSEVVNIVQDSDTNLLFTTSESDHGNIYIFSNGSETPVHILSEDQTSANLFKIEDTNSVVSVNSIEHQCSNVSSPSNEYSMNTSIENIHAQYSNVLSPTINLGIDTPEDSNSSCEDSKSCIKQVSKLKLTMVANQPFILNTPDVLDSVVSLEDRFNILDYMNDQEITTVNAEDIHCENPSTSREIKDVTPKMHKRKTRRDDDDEDYAPPSKKASRKMSVYSSDYDSDVDGTPPESKRGRPSRRASSICSDHSDASKYRELRDKNNEASRRSRLKRKIKDLTLQKEADELYEKNVKLKAQVGEYEKMVNNFRSNLFRILLKK